MPNASGRALLLLGENKRHCDAFYAYAPRMRCWNVASQVKFWPKQTVQLCLATLCLSAAYLEIFISLGNYNCIRKNAKSLLFWSQNFTFNAQCLEIEFCKINGAQNLKQPRRNFLIKTGLQSGNCRLAEPRSNLMAALHKKKKRLYHEEHTKRSNEAPLPHQPWQ